MTTIYLCNIGSCGSLVALNLLDFTWHYRDLCDVYRALQQATINKSKYWVLLKGDHSTWL